jgi:hypothetical protein
MTNNVVPSSISMTAEPPPSQKISGQTLIFIAMIVLLFLFFIWSAMTARRSGNYEDIPDQPAKTSGQDRK